MIITTTPSIEGRRIVDYRGIVFGEAQRAASAGANAVVGVDVDYEVLGADGNMLMVTVSGTAVVVE